ncbi:MAG: rSAM/selenodomain-associated transferase 1 [Cyclobacteriaceae bacterium]|jgi:rSAM/selenodomain-associated transferase 1
MNNNQLIVFVKNLIPGMVKTRLAKDIGQDMAMEVYKELVSFTAEISDKVKNVDKAVYYSLYVEMWDFFNDEKYQKSIQQGNDLGQRMLNAFYDAFEEGYEKVVLIGSDTPDISKKLIIEAYAKLDDSDVVVGPAEDGGYYLIGMKDAHKELFEGMTYSHADVYQELMETAEDMSLKVSTIQTLFDIDTVDDMKKAGIEIVDGEHDDEDPADEHDEEL